MPKALEEKMNNIWTLYLRTREFRNREVDTIFKKLNIWRSVSCNLIKEYKEMFPNDAYANKERLVFSNPFEYLSNFSGEYILLTKDFLSIFTKGKIPIFVGNFPIFVQLKSLPVFWINGGIITLWNFYFPTSKTERTLKEVLEFSNEIAVFPRLELSSFNFIQTYSSKPNHTLSYSFLQKENPRMLEFLERYLTKNFWIIPEINIREVNPFSIVFLKGGILAPCTPHRVVFKVLNVSKVRPINLLSSKIKCLEIYISYMTSSGRIQEDLVYLPIRLINARVEKEKIYNGLLFTFIDFDEEQLFPILFSFYEEDLHSYEIFQELLLMYFKRKYIVSKSLCSIEFEEEEFWNEIESALTQLWRKGLLLPSEEAFLKLDRKKVLELIFSGLYPMLVSSENRIFHTPPPIGLLNLGKEKLKKLVEWYDTESLDLSVHAFTKMSDVIPSYPAYRRLVKDLKQKALLIRYLKEMAVRMGER